MNKPSDDEKTANAVNKVREESGVRCSPNEDDMRNKEEFKEADSDGANRKDGG